jgi:2-oxoglutarate ferredoxin oxidoreductase subunit alpha
MPNPAVAICAIPRRPVAKTLERISQVIIRFAGDSGDGMQLTGARFTSETAVVGTTCRRCPTSRPRSGAGGLLPGVSGFQIHFADHDILTPGDRPNVLVAMNPAALKTNIRTPRAGR